MARKLNRQEAEKFTDILWDAELLDVVKEDPTRTQVEIRRDTDLALSPELRQWLADHKGQRFPM